MGQKLCPSLKALDILLATHYTQYMIYTGGNMEYIKQIRMQRYMKTAEYKLEQYNKALYICGEALY